LQKYTKEALQNFSRPAHKQALQKYTQASIAKIHQRSLAKILSAGPRIRLVIKADTVYALCKK